MYKTSLRFHFTQSHQDGPHQEHKNSKCRRGWDRLPLHCGGNVSERSHWGGRGRAFSQNCTQRPFPPENKVTPRWLKLGTVVHTYTTSTGKAKTGGTKSVPGHLELHSEALSQEQNTTTTRSWFKKKNQGWGYSSAAKVPAWGVQGSEFNAWYNPPPPTKNPTFLWKSS